MRLDLDQEAKLRRMVAGGFTLAGIAEHLHCTIHKAKLLVHEYGLRKKGAPRERRRTRDVELRDVPIGGAGDQYHCTTGADDRYLEALKRHFPERIP